ncbi:uncharacterized protein LOC143683501 [Tamandua tetradactyla]|uniref:uncharacterized protein LOC143683501 n=1 Tax=Tamandua tetradactyla TaxID=48850 RepID=UPI00405427CB
MGEEYTICIIKDTKCYGENAGEGCFNLNRIAKEDLFEKVSCTNDGEVPGLQLSQTMGSSCGKHECSPHAARKFRSSWTSCEMFRLPGPPPAVGDAPSRHPGCDCGGSTWLGDQPSAPPPPARPRPSSPAPDRRARQQRRRDPGTTYAPQSARPLIG